MMLAIVCAWVITVEAVYDVNSARFSGDVYLAVLKGNWPRMKSAPRRGTSRSI